MNYTEDELRDALTLLEQRAPQTAAAVEPARRRSALRRRRLPVLLSVAAAILLAVGLSVLVTRSPGHQTTGAPVASPSLSAPANPDISGCSATPAARSGVDQHLLPDTPTSVTICREFTAPRARQTTTTTAIGPLVAALKSLPTKPEGHGCTIPFPGAVPALGTYLLHFHYPTGPDVEINVLPQCTPSVNNRYGRDATNATPVTAALNTLLTISRGHARLTIKVVLNGGPNVNGHGGATNTPQPGVHVTVLGAAGTQYVHVTNQHGNTTFHLTPDTYRAYASPCNQGRAPAPTVVSDRANTLQTISCIAK